MKIILREDVHRLNSLSVSYYWEGQYIRDPNYEAWSYFSSVNHIKIRYLPRGKSLLKIAYVIFVILKSHDFFSVIFVILVTSSDFFVWFFSNFSVIFQLFVIFGALCMWFFLWFCDFLCDFFVISREVYEKKSVNCPSLFALPCTE